VWEFGTGRAVGEPLTGHMGPVRAVAVAVLDGDPVAVSGGADGTLGRGNSPGWSSPSSTSIPRWP
jgi:hypothetical protein